MIEAEIVEQNVVSALPLPSQVEVGRVMAYCHEFIATHVPEEERATYGTTLDRFRVALEAAVNEAPSGFGERSTSIRGFKETFLLHDPRQRPRECREWLSAHSAVNAILALNEELAMGNQRDEDLVDLVLQGRVVYDVTDILVEFEHEAASIERRAVGQPLAAKTCGELYDLISRIDREAKRLREIESKQLEGVPTKSEAPSTCFRPRIGEFEFLRDKLQDRLLRRVRDDQQAAAALLRRRYIELAEEFVEIQTKLFTEYGVTLAFRPASPADTRSAPPAVPAPPTPFVDAFRQYRRRLAALDREAKAELTRQKTLTAAAQRGTSSWWESLTACCAPEVPTNSSVESFLALHEFIKELTAQAEALWKLVDLKFS